MQSHGRIECCRSVLPGMIVERAFGEDYYFGSFDEDVGRWRGGGGDDAAQIVMMVPLW